MSEEDDGNWTTEILPLCLDRCPSGHESHVHGGIMSFGEDEQGTCTVWTNSGRAPWCMCV